MLTHSGPPTLSRVLAVRMIIVSVSVSVLLAVVIFVHYASDIPALREATLRASAGAIAAALEAGSDPASMAPYRDYPDAYGFRVFDRRLLATRRVLAEANPRWLPEVQHLKAPPSSLTPAALAATGKDLTEGFERLDPAGADLGGHELSLLVHRVVVGDKKYWVQVYMIGDPAWMSLPIIGGELVSRVLFPVLFLVPALTLAMFLTVRGAMRPLRRLSREATQIGAAVSRGQALVPVSQAGMARELADVADAVNAMLGKLQRTLQLQKQFASDAAHELRTPLAILLLQTSQLPSGPSRDRIKADIRDLSARVNELLRFAQAEDAMVQETGDVDIAAAARRICEEAVPEAVQRGQKIEFDCAQEPVLVKGSATLIEIAIRNTVDNALRYSPPQTIVRVRVARGPVVIVEDEGPGIPEDQRERVFERFWRTDVARGNGTGIGLALVRRIAQLHDGDVRIESSASGGTRIVMSLAAAGRIDRVARLETA